MTLLLGRVQLPLLRTTLKNNIEFKELKDNDIDKIALFTAKGMNLGVYFKSFDQT